MFEYLYTFLIAFLLDIIWVLYIKAVNENKAFLGATYGAILYGSSAFLVVSYVNNKYLILSVLLGAFLGTYLTIKLKERKIK